METPRATPCPLHPFAQEQSRWYRLREPSLLRLNGDALRIPRPIETPLDVCTAQGTAFNQDGEESDGCERRQAEEGLRHAHRRDEEGRVSPENGLWGFNPEAWPVSVGIALHQLEEARPREVHAGQQPSIQSGESGYLHQRRVPLWGIRF